MTAQLLVLSICLPACLFAVDPGGTPSSTLIVAKEGAADYRTVQAAIYREKITVATPHIQLRGLGQNPAAVVLTYGLSAAIAGGTFKSASTTVTADDFYAENLTFENSFSRTHPHNTSDRKP